MERILVLGKWGFPLGKKDLTHLIKGYLDRLGKSTRDVSENKGIPWFYLYYYQCITYRYQYIIFNIAKGFFYLLNDAQGL